MDEFFAALRKQSTAKRQDVVEKDYHLHLLLSEISSDGYLRDNLIFKGGTCLIKAYLGYYRFSEDLDFTWKNVDVSMNSKSRSQCGKEAEKVIQHLKIITDRLGLRFSGKKDGEDVTFGSGGRMVIIKPTYYSELEKTRKEVKMGLNFFDETIFSATEKDLETYLDDIESRELKLLFEEPYKKYSQKVRLTCYDCREIFVEKCRALMTRPVYKHRDSLDLYMMIENINMTLLIMRVT